MSKISDFGAVQSDFNKRVAAAIQGAADGVASMKALIDKIQTTPGEVITEDQAILDNLSEVSRVATEKLEAVNALVSTVQP